MTRAVVALALVASLVATARADEPGADGATVVVPPGTVCTYQPGDGDLATWLLRERRFCVTRPTIEAANAAHEAKASCETELGKALADNRRLLDADRTPTWVTAAKWATIGGAVVGAFIAGAALF